MSRLSNSRILITGANRGLGLEMVKQLIKTCNPGKIFASCRNPDKADELNAIAGRDPRIHVMKIDVSDTGTFSDAVREVETVTNGEGIQHLINNAGIFRGEDQSLPTVTETIMMEFYRVNTVGPILLTQAFLPLLVAGNANNDAKGLIVNYCSKLGCISDNRSGGYYASRCSRSAMNAATKSMSIDIQDKNIIVIGMNPGWVKTDQGGSSATLEIDESVRGVIAVINTVDSSQSGSVLQYDGQVLEW